jgi:hypothetical protein
VGRDGPARPGALPGVLCRQPAAPVPRGGGGVHDENVRVVDASTGEVILALPGQRFLTVVSHGTAADMGVIHLPTITLYMWTITPCLDLPTGHGGFVQRAAVYHLADGRIRLLTAADDPSVPLRVGGECERWQGSASVDRPLMMLISGLVVHTEGVH